MHTVTILCESAACNAGWSAAAREQNIIASLPTTDEGLRQDAIRYARGAVSRELRYTPHMRCGIGRHGHALYACEVCGHERIYGCSSMAVYA